MNLKETGCVNVDCIIYQAQDRDQWWVPLKAGSF